MSAETVAGDVLAGLPAMLTVTEAARVLRIGRTLAYKLATDYLDGGDGLPVVRLGGLLRVPRESLRAFLAPTDVAVPPVACVPAPSAVRQPRRASSPRPVTEQRVLFPSSFER